MPNTTEKLVELIGSTEYGSGSLSGNNFQKGFIEKIADHIIASRFIEELQNEAYDLGADSALHNHFGLSWKDAAGLRKEVKRLQDAKRWIPVTERLPEPGERVLVSIGAAFEAFIDEQGKWQRYYSAPLSEVLGEPSHWMPLPEPPKGD